jgi:molybdopterin-guanine dinucleotide biosynthesis protein
VGKDKLIANLTSDLSKSNLDLSTVKTENENRIKKEEKDRKNSTNNMTLD